MVESGKWICDKCRSERLRLLEEKLQNTLLKTDNLTRKNKALVEQLRLAAAGREVGRRHMVPCHLKCGQCLVLGNSSIWNVGTECSDMKVECFLGIRMEQLHTVIEYRDLGRSDTVVNHVGTNNLRRIANLSYVMGDVYDLVHMAKTKFSTSRVALSSVLQRRDVSWWCIGAINSRYDWVVETIII